jgi:predicted SnoaL-like aldol condensation-catalyzing enzyme
MVIGEGNFVLVVSEANLGGKPSAIYDLFRLENGKIAEHWDIIDSIPPKDQWKNANGKF